METVLSAEAIVAIMELIEAYFDEQAEQEQQADLTSIENSLKNVEGSLCNDDGRLAKIEQQLTVIDTRLDTEFIAINDCFSIILGALICFFGWNFVKMVFSHFTVG